MQQMLTGWGHREGVGIRKTCMGAASNHHRKSFGGKWQASTRLNSSLDIIRCECKVFSHFKDATAKVSMIGNCAIMRAKGTIEGTNICMEKTGSTFNLKTKGLDMRGSKITVNEINLVDGGKRHLHTLSGFIEMDRVGFKFSFEKTSEGRRGLDIINPSGHRVCWAVFVLSVLRSS